MCVFYLCTLTRTETKMHLGQDNYGHCNLNKVFTFTQKNVLILYLICGSLILSIALKGIYATINWVRVRCARLTAWHSRPFYSVQYLWYLTKTERTMHIVHFNLLVRWRQWWWNQPHIETVVDDIIHTGAGILFGSYMYYLPLYVVNKRYRVPDVKPIGIALFPYGCWLDRRIPRTILRVIMQT